MKLTIITINRNNAEGLAKTLHGINQQTCKNFEHVIVDGASTDNSVDVIRQHENASIKRVWISEPDLGIYNAMNKGIRMASGEYVQFLNSGDMLAGDNVVGDMLQALEMNHYPSILYGNMLKDKVKGKVIKDRGFAGQEITFLGFYAGTLNHSPAYIRKELFEKYGMYDETFMIVSDWKWYLQAIVLGVEKPVYTDVDVTIFDMNGISETNKELESRERKQVLDSLIPASILADYERYFFPIEQMKRLKRHAWAYKLVWFLERVLFKLEKFLLL